MATFGLFRLAQVLLTYMEQRGKGALLFTSATAAMRGNAGQHSHASAMGGRRWLCQSLNAQCASKGIHVAHIVIDGAVMLFEPGAIVEYIIARHRKGALKAAVDSPLFPRHLQWSHYCEGMVMPPISTIMVHTPVAAAGTAQRGDPEPGETPADEDAGAAERGTGRFPF